MNADDPGGRRPALSGGHFRTLLLALFLPGWTVLWGILAVSSGWLKSAPLFRVCLGTWSRGILFVGGVRVEAARPQALTNEPCVFVANHQSALDIPILSTACLKSHDVRFMAKESLFRVPFLGWGISGNGFIPIRRDNARHAAKSFDAVTSKASAGYSYVIFPEGTRSDDGRIQDFKRGAIALVLRLNRPLVPVTIVDACRANPKGRLLVRPGTVRVIFHDPIRLPENAADDRDLREELAKRTHDIIASALPDDQRPAQ